VLLKRNINPFPYPIAYFAANSDFCEMIPSPLYNIGAGLRLTTKQNLLLIFLLLLGSVAARAATCTWTGTQSTDWNNPANWSCGSVPTAADSVVLQGGANMPLLQGNAVVRSLFFAQTGSLNGTGALIVTGYLRASGTSATFQVKTTVSGTLLLQNATLTVAGQRFEVAGTANIEGGSVTMTGAGRFYVRSGATAVFNGAVNVFGFVADTTFLIEGTLLKNGGGVLDFEAIYAFRNATIQVNGGSVANYYTNGSVASSITNSNVSIASGAALRVHRTLNVTGSVFSGNGAIQAHTSGSCSMGSGNTVNLAVEVYGGSFSSNQSGFSIPSLRMEGGTYLVPNGTISGNLLWWKGTINGQVSVLGTSTISDTTLAKQDKLATGLTLAGGGTYSGNDRPTGNITLPANATWALNATQNVEINASLNLQGTLVKNGKDTVTLSGFLLHAASGTMRGRGTLKMTGGHVFQGRLAPGNGIDTLTIKQNTLSMQPGASLDFEINGSQHDKLYINNNLNVTGGVLNLTEYASAPTGTYVLVETSGTVMGNFASANLPPGYIVTYNTNRVNIVKSTLAPIANFNVASPLGCAPYTVQFNNTSANATSYLWSFPGGQPSSSTATNPVVTYPNLGFFDVTLQAFNTAGSSNKTLINFIEVRAAAQPGFGFSVNNPVVQCTNTSQNAFAYVWNFGDGSTSTEASPAHTYLYDGTYAITLGAINACDTVFLTQNVSVFAPPVPKFSAPGTTGCVPFNVQFANDSENLGNPATFQWAFPGGTPSSSSDITPLVTYETAGTFDVTLTAANSIGPASITKTAYITAQTIPQAAFAAFVTGYSVFFSNQSQNATAYYWDLGDGTVTAEASPTHVYATEGFYIVKMTATNGCGSKLEQQTVVIVGPPTVDFGGSPLSGCAPLTVQYNNLSQNANAWNWTLEGGDPASSTAYNPTVIYNMPGTYAVTLAAFNASGQGVLTKTAYVTVAGPPVPGFLLQLDGNSISTINTSQNAQSYVWNFGDGNSSMESNPVHTYSAAGSYTVTLTATGPCGTQSTQNVVTIIPNDVFEVKNGDFHVFPNPNGGVFDVFSPKDVVVEKWELCHADGTKPLDIIIVPLGTQSTRVLLTHAPPGLHLLRMHTRHGIFVQKIVTY
jgi:PKD repeat protein